MQAEYVHSTFPKNSYSHLLNPGTKKHGTSYRGSSFSETKRVFLQDIALFFDFRSFSNHRHPLDARLPSSNQVRMRQWGLAGGGGETGTGMCRRMAFCANIVLHVQYYYCLFEVGSAGQRRPHRDPDNRQWIFQPCWSRIPSESATSRLRRSRARLWALARPS